MSNAREARSVCAMESATSSGCSTTILTRMMPPEIRIFPSGSFTSSREDHRARDRAEAVTRMRRALAETVVEGIKTTITFHLKLLADPTFLAGDFAIPRFEQHS